MSAHAEQIKSAHQLYVDAEKSGDPFVIRTAHHYLTAVVERVKREAETALTRRSATPSRQRSFRTGGAR